MIQSCVQMKPDNEFCTYTLQRQSPVALGPLDPIPVSLLVLVVVGVAVGRMYDR